MLFRHTFAAEPHCKLEGFIRESEGLDIKQHFLLNTYVRPVQMVLCHITRTNAKMGVVLLIANVFLAVKFGCK